MDLRIVCIASMCGVALSAHPLGPGAGAWDLESPEAHGLDIEALKIAKQDLFAHELAFTSRDCLVVIKDGALVFEEYSSNDYKTSNHDGFSATKTLGALVAGVAVTHHNLDIDADITKTYGVASPKNYSVTSRQIMSQALAGDNSPGEAWAYDGMGGQWINTMAKVVEAATGIKPSQIWEEKISKPLGLDSLTFDGADSSWATGSKGTCLDYARIGQLMLNKGSWKDMEEPIVSANYVQELSTPQTRYAPHDAYANPCYGLLTWLPTQPNDLRYPGVCTNTVTFPPSTPPDMYFAYGLFGQAIMVMPSYNAVVVSMGTSMTQEQNEVALRMYNAFCKGKVFEDCEPTTTVQVAEDILLV